MYVITTGIRAVLFRPVGRAGALWEGKGNSPTYDVMGNVLFLRGFRILLFAY